LFSNNKIKKMAGIKGLRSLSALVTTVTAGLVSGYAMAAKPFDDIPSEYSADLSTAPMYTLVGITDWGKSILDVYGITTIVLTFIFLGVAIPCVYALYKFRATGEETELPKQVTGNHLLEILWTVVPVGLLLFIAVPTWEVIFEQDRAQKQIVANENALKVKVIGHQWWWEFQYPDYGVTTANELVLPENTPVEFIIDSVDVIHSFYIPRFGGKIDAVPGVTNKLVYTTPKLVNKANSNGDIYQGHCLELCGLSHALMRFEAIVKSEADFNKFITSHNNAPVVMTEREKRGEQVFAQCMSCHTIEGTPSADLKIAKIGPDLSNFGNRRYLGSQTRLNTMKNLKEWIKDPASIKPGSLMPALGLSDEQIDDVSAYIQFSTAKDLK
jgi:cytochrome c oxidase subunit 2